MRVVFLGNARWSVPSLEAVARSHHRVVLVVTRVPRPAGRGSRLTRTPVADAAERLGLPLAEVETVKRGPGFEAIRSARPDVLAVVAYGEILPQAVLDLPSVAPVNVHFSLLPALRGAAPVQRAILAGLDRTGVTTIRMDEGMDTGPILLAAEEPILPEDDAGTLGARLAELGGRLLVETLDRLEAGTVEERPQDHAAATLAPRLTPEDRVVDWGEDAEAVVRRVRALAPDPAAVTRFRGRVLKLFRARAVPVPDGAGPPGTVALVSADGFAVAAGRGAVRLEEVAPEGRRRMSGAEFVHGYRPRVGERLG
ncbi:MAG TPA: methionyl-tRNA formyltransferase [Actinomycetota bacterium]|nr:methionyl-tRNA formyltransferase [Actinomycetota bacterium]